MTGDLRDSLKLWAGGIAVAAIFWIEVRFDVLKALSERLPAGAFWIGIGIVAAWNLGRFGYALRQRRHPRPR